MRDLRGRKVECKMIPANKMFVSPFERRISPTHLRRLKSCIEETGFIAPLIVVRRENKDGEDLYEIIDGQHRFLAGCELGITEFPCVVIFSDMASRILRLNTEKPLSLKDKSFVAYRIYMHFVENEPTIKENDTTIVTATEEPYFITFGIVFSKQERPSFPASTYLTFFHKFDKYFEKEIVQALKEREAVAEELLNFDSSLTQVVRRVEEEMGIKHPYLKRIVFSFLFTNYLMPKAEAITIGWVDEGLYIMKKELENPDFLSSLKEYIRGAVGNGGW